MKAMQELIELSTTPFNPALKDWKEEKGLAVNITNTSDIPDIDNDGLNDTDVWHYINDSYTNWTNLAYVLLVGDVEHIPTHNFTTATGLNWSTDHYYSDLGDIHGNESYFSEIFVGRIPVKNTSELDVIVDKIIGYEKTPYVDELGWYKQGSSPDFGLE